MLVAFVGNPCLIFTNIIMIKLPMNFRYHEQENFDYKQTLTPNE